MHTVLTRIYPSDLSLNKRAILRYAGVQTSDAAIEALLQRTQDLVKENLKCRVCYCEFPLCLEGDILDLGFARTTSTALKKHLAGCDRIVVFAATVGNWIDRMIARNSIVSPTESLFYQAIGSDAIEALCNTFCRELRDEKRIENRMVRERFSPGYGDLPLTLQTDIFAALDCSRKIGVSLSESLLMTPSKSVTAIVGISKTIV